MGTKHQRDGTFLPFADPLALYSSLQHISLSLSLPCAPSVLSSLYIWLQTPTTDRRKERDKTRRERERERSCTYEKEMPQSPSTRWCPTPEQLMILEEMYRSGESNGGLNLLEKMEINNAKEAPETNYETFGHEWTSVMMLPNRRSLRTLDLFPTTSTGLMDECATSNSSCSTSIN
ncbi:hypothetical protein BHE74_00006616 [Ensete ventricosum]|nr:hypothetical protein BHE74_00006616 [Ensete ventricosum]